MSLLECLVWVVLTFALFWLPVDKKTSFLSFAFSCVGFVYFGVIDIYGVGVLVCFGVLMLLYARFRFFLIEVLLVVGCAGLFFHYLMGFHNPKVLSNVLLSPQSATYTLYFNFDKAFIPFVLIVLLPTLFATKDSYTREISLPQGLFLVCSLFSLLLIATLLGILEFEFHIPSWIFVFVWANLFFVSFVEEALFRGYFQQRLSGWVGEYPALILASLIFASYHLKLSYLLAIFAFFAGLLYGLAWLWSGRVWISTLFHFGLNLTHLIFFTYPYYKP
ncbi:CPBP family intramembrane glutamic endopeptidase [Helicobacter brantae]|uniref:CPBP family intramembrane metalloprotease n=1 Tax=Helicobacter brantae TaxID=375927 RepID=A0A3D8J378_9HELI|nr:CPBP family intramembrane glutamic endopeptidase [Helicobacter brantae]RDU71700.1 CPBP family intramembrane metalloprotease [Helicobacter brantae]